MTYSRRRHPSSFDLPLVTIRTSTNVMHRRYKECGHATNKATSLLELTIGDAAWAIERMHECEVWYHVYPLGFLGAELENPAAAKVRALSRIACRSLSIGWTIWWSWGSRRLLVGPVFESETHGYDVVDPFRVDRRLGTRKTS